MRVSISSDYRYMLTPDGAIWTDGPCHYRHWTRYLEVFGQVSIIARVSPADRPAATWHRADGADVTFAPVPYYLGVAQYLRKAMAVSRAARQAVAPDDAVLLNAPGQLASCLTAILHPHSPRRPYGLQVLGDPYDVLAPGVVRHPLRPLLRWWCTRRLQRQAQHAAAALYVTREALQRRYPCPAISFGVSDVDLTPDAFRDPDRSRQLPAPRRLISVGAMTQMYKGFDILLAALSQLIAAGRELRLVLIGDGLYRPRIETLAKQLGVADRVEFRGQLPAGDRIRQELDAADIFILPSRTEGLPRALIEAMARGMPCIASRVGGIPELLPPEDLAPPGDAAALAAKIEETLQSAARRWEMAQRNHQRAQAYQAASLQTQRKAFFQCVADATADWLKTSRQSSETIHRHPEKERDAA